MILHKTLKTKSHAPFIPTISHHSPISLFTHTHTVSLTVSLQ